MSEYRIIPSSTHLRRDIGNEGNDFILKRIMSQLDTYRRALSNNNEDKQLRALIEIYFCTNQWLQSHSHRRAGHISALYRATVNQLAIHLECEGKLNLLPFRLEELFGKKIDIVKWAGDMEVVGRDENDVINKPGRINKLNDLDGVAPHIQSTQKSGASVHEVTEFRDISCSDTTFLTSQALATRRLSFKNGRIYMWDWYKENKHLKCVRANTVKSSNYKCITPGYSGYALRMDRQLYMTRHSEGSVEGVKVAHSTYTATQAVLCAGEIAIANGKLICVTTGSGHYQPGAEKMFHVLRLFTANGIDFSNAYVRIVLGSNNEKLYRAQEFYMKGMYTNNQLKPVSDIEERQMNRSIPGFIEGSKQKLRDWGLTEAEILENLRVLMN